MIWKNGKKTAWSVKPIKREKKRKKEMADAEILKSGITAFVLIKEAPSCPLPQMKQRDATMKNFLAPEDLAPTPGVLGGKTKPIN